MEIQRKAGNWHILKNFRSCCRYIDDLLLINIDDQMMKAMTEIYPKELVLVPDDTDGKSCPFLDLQVTIRDDCISTSIYDKRDTFDFPIVNFPTLNGNIPKNSGDIYFSNRGVQIFIIFLTHGHHNTQHTTHNIVTYYE